MNLYELNKSKHQRVLDNKDRIIEMKEKGFPTRVIAERFGVTHPTIYYFLVKHGIIEKKNEERLLYPRRRRAEQGDVKPFMERISPELKAMIKRNTEINNARIKRPGSMRREEEKELVGSIAEMTITNIV